MRFINLFIFTIFLIATNVSIAQEKADISHLKLSDFSDFAGIKIGDDCDEVATKYSKNIGEEDSRSFMLYFNGRLEVTCSENTWTVIAVINFEVSDTTYDKTFMMSKKFIRKHQLLRAFGEMTEERWREIDGKYRDYYSWNVNSNTKLTIVSTDSVIRYIKIEAR